MKKLFAALIATAFVAGAFAQAPAAPEAPAAPKKATKKAVEHTHKKQTSQKAVPAA